MNVLKESRGLVTDKKASFYLLGDAVSEFLLDKKHGLNSNKAYIAKGIVKFSLEDVKEYWSEVYSQALEVPFWITNLYFIVMKEERLHGAFVWSKQDAEESTLTYSAIALYGNVDEESFPRLRELINHELRHAYDFYIDKIVLKRSVKNLHLELLSTADEHGSNMTLNAAYESKENLVTYYNWCLYLTINTEMNAFLVSYMMNIKDRNMKNAEDSPLYAKYKDAKEFLNNPKRIKPFDAAYVILALKEEIEKYSDDKSMQVFKNIANYANKKYLDVKAPKLELRNSFQYIKDLFKDTVNYIANFSLNSAGKEKIYATLEKFNSVLLKRVNKQLKRFNTLYFDLTYKPSEDKIDTFQKNLATLKMTSKNADELIAPFEDS